MADTTPLKPAITDQGDGKLPVLGAEKPAHRWPKRVGGIAVAVVALLIGVLIGTNVNNKSGELASAKAANTTLRGRASQLTGQVNSLKGQVASAHSQVQNATSTANAKAAQAYAGRNAALSQQSSSLEQQQTALSRQQQQLKAQLGEIQASQISGDAVYVVGKDIKSGVYHTNGSGDTGASDCYFATLNSTDTSNIADNNNFDGPETVDVSSAYAFEINGPCTWSRVS